MNLDFQSSNQTEGLRENSPITDSMILDIIMKNSQDTIYFKDRNSKFIANSHAHLAQVGCATTEEMIGKSDFDYFPEVFAMQAFLDEKKIMETGIPIISKEEKLILQTGETVWFSASKYPIYDEKGSIIGTWGTSRDITELKRTQEELRQLNLKLESNNQELQKLSDLDGLSELYNQRKFYEILEQTIEVCQKKKAMGHGCTFSVIMMDIDKFKEINDTYGHPAGDTAIRYIAGIIRNNKRTDDFCFRCGGDEFAMILMDTGIESAKFVAERLRRMIEESPLFYHHQQIPLTISAGVKEFHLDDTTYKILEQVDQTLYASKKNGRNQVNF